MKPNNKILSLINAGLNSSTLSELTENQINALYQRLEESKIETKEQTPPGVKEIQKTTKEYQIDPGKEMAVGNYVVKNQNGKAVVTTTNESDDLENDDIALAVSEKDPDLGLAMSDDLQEKFESKSQQKLFFAKCGDGKTKEQKKWCKMAKEFAKSTKDFKKLPEKKEETNEDFSFKDYFNKLASVNTAAVSKGVGNSFRPTFEQKLEESIMNMIQKNIPPKMSKKDFIKTIIESEKEVETPVKPDVDTPSKPKKDTPYQPKHKPAPKAKEKEVETPVKPDVDTPSKPKKDTPYQPKHKPAPKAGKLPDWMSFDSIGINLK